MVHFSLLIAIASTSFSYSVSNPSFSTSLLLTTILVGSFREQRKKRIGEERKERKFIFLLLVKGLVEEKNNFFPSWLKVEKKRKKEMI